MIRIRLFEGQDWEATWQILRATVQARETFSFSPDSSEEELYRLWVGSTSAAYVAEDESGQILGTCYIKPNQPGLGSHVCNCGYAVSSAAQGRGIATLMCEHTQREAIEMGFRAMQFNFVVSTNERAVRLWQHLGFEIIGRVPGAFQHHRLGFVDAFVMFKVLVDC